MITEPQACLRYISSIHRGTVRDIPRFGSPPGSGPRPSARAKSLEASTKSSTASPISACISPGPAGTRAGSAIGPFHKSTATPVSR